MLFIRILFFLMQTKILFAFSWKHFEVYFQLQESIKLISVHVATNNTEDNFNPEIEFNIANSHLYTWVSTELETPHSKPIHLAMFISYRNGV